MRSVMRASSQLPGRGPTDVDDTPCTCMLIKNLIMIYDEYFLKLHEIDHHENYLSPSILICFGCSKEPSH